MDESKKLKDKFDAIFGITEFNKTIERIIKMRKEEVDKLKVKGKIIAVVFTLV